MAQPSNLKVKRLLELDQLPPNTVGEAWMYAVRPGSPNKDHKVFLPDLVEESTELALDIVREELLDPDEGFGSDMIVYKADTTGDTVARSLSEKLSDTLSVKDTGAVGDGLADDKDAIRRAVNKAVAEGRGAVFLPRGRYRIGDLAGTQIVLSSNITIYGEPGTVIFYDDNPANAVGPGADGRAFYLADTDNVSFMGITFEGSAAIYDDPSVNTKQLIGGVRNKNVSFQNCKFRNLRHMALSLGGTVGATVQGCTFENIGRDGARFTHSQNVAISGNVFKNVSDDAVALHSTDTGYTLPVPSGHVVSGNIFDGSNGMRALGIKGITISNNTFRRSIGKAIHIEQGWSGAEGNTPQFAINITGNTILDTLNLNSGVGTPPASICVMSGERNFASLGTRPGITSSRLDYNYINETDIASNPNVAMAYINITNNVIARTLPNVTNYSDWGYGEFFDHRNVGSFWANPTITDTSFNKHGIYVKGPVDGVLIANNNISGLNVNHNAVRFDVTGTANGVDMNDVMVANNVIRDCPGHGVWADYTGSGAAATNLIVQNNVFDLDPFMRHTGHNADNTWVSGAECRGVQLAAGMHLIFRGNTCKHLSQPQSLGGNTAIYMDNIVWSNGAVAGNDASNRGVRVLDPGQLHIIYDADPTSSSFGQVITTPATMSSGIPSSGHYVQGHVVRRTSVTISGTAGSRYALMGWVRITTGTSHTAGTDWAEIRSLTGT